MQDRDTIGTVLLVDADVGHRTWVRDILESQYTVLEATGAVEAGRFVKSIRPDCVILDQDLPDGVGLELVARLSQSGVATIMLTGEADAEQAVAAMKRGAMDYAVRERLQPDELRRLVAHSIERARLKRQVQDQQTSLMVHEKLFAQVLAALPVGVCVLDATGRVRYLNDQARSILGQQIEDGRPLREVLRPADLFLLGTNEPYPLGRLPLFQALTGHSSTVSDLEVNTGGVERRLVQMSASPLHDELGEVRYAVATLQDITEQYQLANQMRQAQRMESVGQLAGGVAHDFNNLLTIIYTCGSLALEGIEAGEDVRSDLKEIVETTARADRLTRQLLAFSRRQVVVPEVVDPNKAISGLESMLRQAVGETVDLQFALQHEVWPCKIDPGALDQVLLNLSVNARDAMPKGGRLVVATDVLAVDAEYGARRRVVVPPGDYTRISVSDTGTGIAAVDLQRIFEPFFTTKGAGHGTGLGLATCYGLIKQAGGYIWVDTEVNVGTRFEVVLPRVVGPVRTDSEAPSQKAAAGHETILLAEDDRPVRRLTERILRRLGYRVLSASNGAEALDVAQGFEEPIDLLLTDVLMPKMNGRELADRFRLQRPNARILYMSGWTDKVLWHHGVTDNVDLLSKPFTPGLLGERVRAALDGTVS